MTAHSTYAAAFLPILLTEYFRPSNGLHRPFSLERSIFYLIKLLQFQTRTGSPAHLAAIPGMGMKTVSFGFKPERAPQAI